MTEMRVAEGPPLVPKTSDNSSGTAESSKSSNPNHPQRVEIAAAERAQHRKPPPMTTKWGDIARKWPKISFCIIVNEFCERFSFYGMRTVLVLYLLNVLGFSDSNSQIFFNIFNSFAYFMAIFGAVLADGYIGKFRTIFVVSIIYAAGQLLLAFSSTANKNSGLHPYLDFAGLFIIGVGTGGIKPCVSPFGGDQFDPHEAVMISLFFSVFYFSINAGSMISTYVSPVFRNMACLGQDTCFPLAFGIPGILMIVATVAFMSGSFWYKKIPVTSNIFKEVAIIVARALKNKWSGRTKREHWLDYAMLDHRCDVSAECKEVRRRRRDPHACAESKLVDDVKSLFRVIVMFLPLPIFWSLYDQQGSVWNLQAIRMDSRLWGDHLILPDQMQVLNAVLILVFIPIFNKYMTQMPAANHVYVGVMNTLDNCNVTVMPQGYGADMERTLAPHTSLYNTHDEKHMLELERGNVTFAFSYAGDGCTSPLLASQATFSVNVDGEEFSFIHVSSRGAFFAPISVHKPTDGSGDFATGLVVALDTPYDGNMVFCRVYNGQASDCNPKNKQDYYSYVHGKEDKDSDLVRDGKFYYHTGNNVVGAAYATVFNTKGVRPGLWRLYFLYGEPDNRDNLSAIDTGVEFNRIVQGGIYLLSIDKPFLAVNETDEWRVVPDNGISILWQVPQIVVITAAEILFSITGLEFSYTQAAPSMKSIIGALFLFTTAIGDIIIVLVLLVEISPNVAIVFIVYAIAMAVVTLVFALLAIFYYDYVNYDEGDIEYGSFSNTSSINDNRIMPIDGKKPSLGDVAYDPKADAWNVHL